MVHRVLNVVEFFLFLATHPLASVLVEEPSKISLGRIFIEMIVFCVSCDEFVVLVLCIDPLVTVDMLSDTIECLH